MTNIFKTILCYGSCIVSNEIKEHYRRYMYDNRVEEYEECTITSTLDVDPQNYLTLIPYYLANIKYIFNENYSSHRKAELLHAIKGYKMICLSEPSVLSNYSTPHFIDATYGDSSAMIGQDYHVLTYIKLEKDKTRTNRELHIAIEPDLKYGTYFYIAMNEVDLFDLLKKRYLYERAEIKYNNFIYTVSNQISTPQTTQDKYIERKKRE
jgi:hypothetical protein